MFKYNQELKSKQFVALVVDIIDTIALMNESTHKLVTFYYDTHEEVLDTSAYELEDKDFSRSIMGRLRTSSIMDQKMVNYITIGTTRQEIRNELLVSLDEIEQLLMR